MRLDYFLAHSTGLSRKDVKQLISRGAVAVDGEARPRANTRLHPGQAVWLHGEPVQLPGHRYLMLHKPQGVVCSTDDPDHRTVLDLLPGAERPGLHAAGRLDLDTTGLVLLTSDGQWSHRLTAPGQRCAKRYRVTCADPVTEADLQLLREGIALRGEDRPTLPAAAESLGVRSLRLTLHEGRYHQVKRMLAALGNKVVALHREQIGEIALDPALAPGQYRALTDHEVASIAPPAS
ncbi:pseudouridylate synthase [Alcanivorax hongdengensis A-11-3]|uniref:Pseudouridine synthase n=1 Tax=Alcanivorax hongdengensis A-11-3 TaxID=1177179 RepID=L0WAA1_9GAMM|nr:pseudouridine synthase [Alcanivorax hongdengensis]EKF73703.1 pseudouridylate synthase [Alcanivorax hongdengensis A-11-3]